LGRFDFCDSDLLFENEMESDAERNWTAGEALSMPQSEKAPLAERLCLLLTV